MKKTLYNIMALATAVLGFTACEDVPEPYTMPVAKNTIAGVTDDEGGTALTSAGTAESPYIVTDIITVAKQMSADEQKENVYVKGIVSQIDEISTQYGNATYYLSIDGTTNNQFEIYRGYGLNGDKFTSADDIKVGDVLVVCGTLVNFRGNTPELTQGSKIISINDPNVDPSKGDGAGEQGGESAGPQGDGTAASPYNVAAILQVGANMTADDQKEDVYVKGKISQIDEISTSYGNATYYISDDGTTAKQFMVYRGYYLNGDKFTAEDQIKLGDEVVVCGTLVNFKGNTLELTQGSKLISINSNGGGETPQPGGEATGDGSLANPFNAAKAAAVAGALASGETSTDSYYIKGKVCSIATDKNGNVQNYDYGTYGNASFYISEDGTENGKFYVYRALYLGNKKWQQGAGDVLKVGDEVIVYGKLTNYNGTPETAPNESYLYSLNGKTEGGETPQPGGEAKGNGTLADPFNAVAANNAASALESGQNSTENYYIKGKISNIKYTFSAQYGTATFYISDDGTDSNTFYIYSTLYLENKSWVEGNTQIAVGDDVIIYGQLTNYNGTLETASKKSYIYSLNGKTTDEGGGETPQPGGDGVGTLNGNVLTVAASDFGLSNATDAASYNLAGGASVSFSKGTGNNTPKYYSAGNGTIRMYAGNTMTINAGTNKIASITLVCNNYNNTIYNASGDAAVGDIQATVDGDNLVFEGINASTATLTNTSTTTGAPSQIRWEQLIITYVQTR